MKFIKSYKVFESKESDLMRYDILDIFLDTNEDNGLDATVYCTDAIVMICIKRSPNYNTNIENKPFNGSSIKSDVERVINYLDDRVLSVRYTYAERKWNATIPSNSIPEGEIYELNVEIRLNKLKEIEKLFSDKTRTNESNETDDVNDIMMMVSDFSEEYDWMKADAQVSDGSLHVRFYKNQLERGSVNLEICYDKMKQILSQFPEYEINSCFFRYEERTKKEDRSTEIKRKLVCLFKYGSDLREYVNMKRKTDDKLENLITDKVDNILNYKYKPYEMLIFKLSKKKKESMVDRFKGLFR